jgi:hypothetical protein
MTKAIIKVLYPFSYTWLDYPDRDSYCVYVSCLGCDNFCSNCHNTILQNYNTDKINEKIHIKVFSVTEFYEELKKFCIKSKDNKVVLGGADFLYSLNIEFTKQFVKSYGNIFDICIYTGYDIQFIKQNNIKGFKFIKVGKYDESLKQEAIKTDSYLQLASTNQEIYNQNYNLVSRNGRMNF